jgi:DNA-directed RNA polymerase specialized sigma24 family protein
MSTPTTPSETEVLVAIENIAGVLGVRFRFGHFTVEDIKQQVAVFALEALPRFRPESGKLENFLYKHARNRLVNFKRDKSHRADPPCRPCYDGTPHQPGPQCRKFVAWQKRNAAKAALTLAAVSDPGGENREPSTGARSSAEADVETAELFQLIDERLDVELRRDYLLMRAGKPVSKTRRAAVMEAVQEILGDAIDMN